MSKRMALGDNRRNRGAITRQAGSRLRGTRGEVNCQTNLELNVINFKLYHYLSSWRHQRCAPFLSNLYLKEIAWTELQARG